MSEIKDLSNELFEKQTREWDEVTLFTRSHLYLEYYLNLSIETLLKNGKELVADKSFTTYLKIEILYGIKYLSKVVYHNCILMNKIRNHYAHNLETNDDYINDKIEKMEIPWLTSNNIKRLTLIERYRSVTWAMVTELKNALKQNRKAMFYPDETEYDIDKKKYL